MTFRSAGLAAGLLTLLAGASPALAAPATVDLRVEGATRTLFEGSVTTDVRPFRFTQDPVAHRCDATGEQGESPTPVPTRGAALAQAAESAPFSLTGTWSDQYLSPSFLQIAGESTAYDPVTGNYLAEYKNARSATIGACGDPIVSGDKVLFAYGTGLEPLLALAGPAVARPGEAVELQVTQAADGQPVSGAVVQGQATGADGRVRVVAAGRGAVAFKASKPGAIRSNRITVCVTDGQDGSCGTTAAGQPGSSPSGSAPAGPVGPATARARDTSAPAARLTGIREQQTFSSSRAPRVLRGKVGADPSGLATVKLRLTRRDRGRCAYLSGRKERFVRTSCGRSFYFAIGDRAEFSYLLPERLVRGRYVLDVIAVDRAGNRDALARGRNRVVFTVR